MALENLLVSKINDVQVIQVDESKTSVINKKAESKKPSQKGGNPFETSSGGENKTVDLGAGARKYTAKFYAFDKAQIDKLSDILLKQRFCTITDKFKGKLSVYIDSYEEINDDKHEGKTIFLIGATIQDIEKTPIINSKAQLENIVEDFEIELSTASQKFADNVETVATAPIVGEIVDNTQKATGFVDASLDQVEKGIQTILDLELIAVDFFSGIQTKTNKIKRVSNTLALIKQLPLDFIKMMQETASTGTSKLVELFFAVTSTGVVVQKLEEFVSEDGVINVTNTELSNLSQIELEELKKTVEANELLNLTTAVDEIKQILTKEYTSQQDFDKQVILTITRLGVTSLSDEKIVNARQVLKSFSNQTSIKGLIDYEVAEERPLTAILYKIYGHLDFYIELRDINNFKDNDAIVGTLQVYDV